MDELLTCAKAPCKSCPYRRDVPSGIWAASEYDKLPGYDGSISAQFTAGALGLFMCHQQDGKLCAGWIGAHGTDNLLAIRLNSHKLHESVFAFKSPVRLFRSGAEAAEHGRRAIKRPGPRAEQTIARLVRKRKAGAA